MPERPPTELTEMLERLGLATPAEVRRMGRRVRRLARDLPRFESVWVDALAQARILTRLQAAEINAGRGRSLRVGPYLLCERLRWPGYVGSYRARHVRTGKIVHLAVVENGCGRDEETLARLESLAATSKRIRSDRLALIRNAGMEDAHADETVGGTPAQRIWAAADWVDGLAAADWMVHNGRFPSGAAMQIAASMLRPLVALEKAGLCHGDISTHGMVLASGGNVVLQQPGLRAILRPEEGYAHADLQPEAFDYLAPERITDGTPPSAASDIYACGCVWWHLLCGRPPLAGGDALAKLRSAQTAKVFDVRRLAPEVPARLAAAISSCLQQTPDARPGSMAELAETLGPPPRAGRKTLVRCLARPQRLFARPAQSRRPQGKRRSHRAAILGVATAAFLAVTAAIISWPAWKDRALAWHEATKAAGTENRTSTQPQGKPSGRDQPEDSLQKTLFDPAVTPAHHVVEQPASGPQDLVLDAAKPLQLDSLALEDGQCIRGKPGTRPTIYVPGNGLLVEADNVRFENIDFLYDNPGNAPDPNALVHLETSRAEFRGCSFRVIKAWPGVSAIRWTHREKAADPATLLPGGRLRFSDCVLHGVTSGIYCRCRGAVALELRNVLYLGRRGPLIQFDHYPSQEEPIRITLAQVTLRSKGFEAFCQPLLQCNFGQVPDAPGDIAIEASACVFACSPLIVLSASGSPQSLLRNIRWTGQGSLVVPKAMIAGRLPPTTFARPQKLDDAALSIDGLVRSEVTFAGERTADPADSEVTAWQAPLRSTDPPGIDASRLPPVGR